MSDPYLFLWLEAPLQAWGHDSRFGRRDSLDFPTKSGVLGMLCCALGADGQQTEWLGRWANLDMQVTAFVHQDREGQPIRRAPLLRDFHMVGSGYNDQDPWANLMIPKTTLGKKAVGPGTKITYRYYLQDMAFAVALQAPADEVNEVLAAVKAPVWDLYLGRKCCVPTEFIGQGIFSTAGETLTAAKKLASDKNLVTTFTVHQGEHEGEVISLNDVPLQFGQDKRYRDRRVTVIRQV